jgi:16S rRNA G966 N2-methylase RsmD
MNTKVLKKIFPEPPDCNYNNLLLDDEGLWSITHIKDADLISHTIIEIMGTNKLNILDMTAGCGGNMISFINNFYHTTGIEINENRFNLLKNNLDKYKKDNYILINGNSIEYIKSLYDVYYIDPPWGGPDYKNNQSIELYLSNISIYDIIQLIPVNKLIVLKLPFNYNIDKFNKYILKKIILNNIIILFIRI